MNAKAWRWFHSDFLTVGLAQVAAAVGQLIGVRLLTEALSPAVFGELTLIAGISTLATSVLVHPTMQALLRYYPEYLDRGERSPVEGTACRRIMRHVGLAVPLSIPLLILGWTGGWVTVTTAVLLLVLVMVDGLQMFRATIMNAGRQHRRYGAWQIGDAWGRPLLAYAAIGWLGVQTEVVLGAYILASATVYVSMNGLGLLPPKSGETADADLSRKFASYAAPLVPLGVLGWLSGMADRYMIAGLLSPQSVGMYAAAYGLASRPLLMLSSVAETSIRPVYYSAIARHDATASRQALLAWLGIVVFGGTAACLALAWFHQDIAQVLLGPAFRDSSYLMPWIAAGYALFAVYHITVRVCLAHDAPQAVTLTEAARAILALAIGFVFIRAYGVSGAAMAVPIYCGIQLLASVYLAARSVRTQAGKTGALVASAT